MIIDGNSEPLRPSGRADSTRPTDRARPNRSERQREDQKAEANPPARNENSVYNTEALRAAAGRLLDEGGVEATRDGEVRHNRVAQIRSKLDAGEYDRREIIADVVDRLMDKWNI